MEEMGDPFKTGGGGEGFLWIEVIGGEHGTGRRLVGGKQK